MIILKKPQNGEKITLLTDEQLNFISTDRSQIHTGKSSEFDYLNLKIERKIDCSFPKSIRFEWKADEKGIIQISENEEFDFYYSGNGENFYDFENLKCGTRYFWRVLCENEISDTFYFDTKDEYPRVIKIDGITNVRDCGGWKVENGKRIRQGMLYRGSEMNSHVNITNDGLETMREMLKIKSVLDLRGETEVVEDVYKGNYANISVAAYRDWFDYSDTARKVFEFLFDKENYPVYFHCWGGADRTGTVAFLVGAVLGMNYDNLADDYEFTSLSIWGMRTRHSEERFKNFYEFFNSFEGDTIKEKAEKYLLSCGISKASIEDFRDFMIEQ